MAVDHFTCLRALFAVYPAAKATDETMKMYLRFLSDIPIEELEVVTAQAIVDCTFLPSIAELRSRWKALTFDVGQPTAIEAWAEVERQMRHVGRMGHPTFSTPLIGELVRSIGWFQLCTSELPGVERAHFIKAYEQMVNREQQVRGLLPASRRLAEQTGGLKQIDARKLLSKHEGDSHDE